MKVQSVKIGLLLLAAGFVFCSRKTPPAPEDQVVAIVAQDTIYVNDFLRRTEFTVRPNYCQRDGMQDKRICLNSLIAEKLFALEAGDDNELIKNENFRARLQGIKEQAMREQLIRDMVVDKIHISREEIDRAYINSRKTVHTQAVFIPKNVNPEAVYAAAKSGVSFDELGRKFPGVSPKVIKDIKWGHIDEQAQEAVFSDKVTKGSLLPPLAERDGWRLIKVTGWSEDIELSPANRNLQKENIKSGLMDYYIRKEYTNYAQKLMRGKRIDFDPRGWKIVVEALQPLYLAGGDSIGPARDMTPEIEEAYAQMRQRGDAPFMKIDGRGWSVAEFQKTINVHPLELSTKGLSADNFQQRLQAAVAGLITDHTLTQLAYKKKYDRSYAVNRIVHDWKTYYLFLYQRDRYLREKQFTGDITRDYFEAFDEYLTPYLDSLKIKYDEVIVFHPQALDNLQLTRLPMIAYKTAGPYRQVVPPFPLVTNSNKTNYRRLR